MTREVRTMIEPKDVKAIEIECGKCHYRTVRPVGNWLKDSMICGNCLEQWMNYAGIMESLRDAAAHLRTVSLQIETAKAPFTVRLELAQRDDDEAHR